VYRIVGTRDLFLSNRVRRHRELLDAGMMAGCRSSNGRATCDSSNPLVPEIARAFSDAVRIYRLFQQPD
jgi:hypothetical protein